MRRRQIIQAQQRGEYTYPGPPPNPGDTERDPTPQAVPNDLAGLVYFSAGDEQQATWTPPQRRKRSRR